MSNPGPNITSTVVSNDVMEVNPVGAASGDGKLIGKAASSLVGMWGAVPAAQPASALGDVHTPAAGSVTGVFVNTTFDGTVGTKAYTIGDIVANLKACGILAT